MKYDVQKLEQMSLADLIALESLMEKHRSHWTKVASGFPEDSEYYEDAMNHYKICTSVRDVAAGTVADRLNEIFPDYEL